MKKIIILSILSLSLSLSSFGIVRVSTGVGTSWTDPTTWSPAGIPGGGDDLTILSGHTVTISGAASCRNLVVSGTIQWLANVFLSVLNNYTLNPTGLEKGTGQIQFTGPGVGAFLTVTGTTAPTVRYYFASNRTISSSSVISKLSSVTQLAAGKIVTNLGNFTLGTSLLTATSKWINGSGSTLTLTINGFVTAAGLFDPSPANNTVILNYVTGLVPKPMAGSNYSNLTISGGSGTKSLQQNLVCTGNITVNAGATLNANNYDISLAGNWVKNGSFSPSLSHVVTFNGSVAQTLSGTGTTSFEQLAINNSGVGVSVSSGAYSIKDVLTMSQGNINSNGSSFTLASSASRTARIAPITPGRTISGDFIIERFITARDTTWSDLSSPVQTTTFVDWDNELPAISYIYNPPLQQCSAFAWDEPSNNLNPVTSSSTVLNPGVGYEVYLSNDFTYSAIPNITMNTIGIPNQGDQNLSSLISYTAPYPSGSSNLVGNPFASSISWSSVLAASSNLDPTIDMYDWTAGSYTNYGAGTVIGSSQGFWVYTLSAGATLHVNESAKTAATNSSLRSALDDQYFTLKLSNCDKSISYNHTLKVSNSNDATDGYDAGKDHMFRKSPLKSAPEIYSTIDGINSVINVFNSNDETYNMPLATTVGISGYYRIDAKGFDFLNDFTCVKLEDKLLNTTVDLSANPTYAFRINAGDNENRFIIHFSKSGSCKSLASSGMGANTTNSVEILPILQGNTINFNYGESTNTTISLTNMLGQTITDVINVEAYNQTVNVSLPDGFAGMYLVKIESSYGTVVKKFVK